MTEDDYAVIYAVCRQTDVELAGIITTAGIKTAKQAQNEAKAVLKALGKENISVYAGAENPTVRDNFYRPASVEPGEHGNGAQAYMNIMKDIHDDVTLVLLGGATNAAQFIIQQPELAKKIKKIVFSGGCFAYGDVTPVATANAYYDPEALDIVANSGREFYLIPLELTSEIKVDEKVLESIAATCGMQADVTAFPGLSSLNAALNPEAYNFKKYKCGVETEGDFVRGMTVVYLNGLDYAENRTDGVWVSHKVKEQDKNCFYPTDPRTDEICSSLHELLATKG